ncbi:MAG TPA: hypothetical protein VNS88_16905, partial [Nitrospiraceae bacterium]|nr:hypothetical protein [Nitrospiraceae bacterium]
LPSFVRNLEKTLDEMQEVSGVLRQDIENLVAAYRNDWSSQPLRRMFVRAYWSMIEGEVFCTKQFTLRACQLGDNSLSAEEHVFLSESRVIVDEEGAASLKHAHIDTLSNLKQTLKVAASKFDLDWAPNFSTQGWEKLALSLELRHRITHPKVAAELVVSESELDIHKDAFAWFLEACNEFQSSLLRRYDAGSR